MRLAPPLIAALAALALALAPPAAHGYGTSTTWVTGLQGTPPGAWANLAGARSEGDGDAATLTETEAAGASATLQPANRTFDADASGWTAQDNGAPLCSVSSGHDAGDGAPPGSIRTSYATLLNLLNLLAECDGTWTSDAFTWTGGTPASVAFQIDRLVDLNGLVGLATATWTVRLVDETAGGSTVLVSGSRTSDSGWSTQTAAGLGPGSIVSGRSYRIRIEVAFSSTLSLVSGFGVSFDNVRLSITPQNMRAIGELVVGGVPPGSTHTLELRAGTSGEAFDVQVFDGTAWTTRGTIAAATPAADVVTRGLTPQEWNGGTVRVRLVDQQTGADDAADVVSVDYVRVVSTGGISVSGPASVTMPPVTIDGVAPQVSTAPLGDVEVVDAGGAASGWTLSATATRWALDGSPGELLPADAFTAAPGAPTTPDGSDLTGVGAGAGGNLGPSVPIPLMVAGPGTGVGTYRQNPTLALTVPVTARRGVYRSQITLTVS